MMRRVIPPPKMIMKTCLGSFGVGRGLKMGPIALAATLLVATVRGDGHLAIAGADGSDGAFTPSGASVTINLAEAATGAWDAPSPTAGKGIYDSTKRAVVFKYSSVNIPAGTEVKFSNRAGYPPVVWLVSGDVTVNGVLNLSGQNANNKSIMATEPGPGGFRGGAGYVTAQQIQSGGFGPGGGLPVTGYAWSGPGNYSSSVNSAIFGTTYGNSRILPLLGGSGGAGANGVAGLSGSGGAGGGAILIAARGSLLINGRILANGGLSDGLGSGGSGGAVRLIGSSVSGAGTIEARSTDTDSAGGNGRVRIETPDFSNGLTTFPATVGVRPDNPPVLWLPSDAPQVRVTSVLGTAVPIDPKSNLGLAGADVLLTDATNVVIEVEGKNLAAKSVVTVRIVPLSGMVISTNATFVSGDLASSVWRTQVAIPKGFCAVQARAVTP